MASKVQIAKLALQHIGDRYDISALTEDSVEAEQVNLIYDDVRKEVLRMHPWRFATRFTSPATLSVTVPANWTYAYTYPSDGLRILQIEDPLGRDLEQIPFETAVLSDDTRVILTDELDAEFRYIYDEEDPTKFDPEFVNAFSFMLASRMAMALTGDGGIKQALAQEAYSHMSQAGATDANEGRKKKAPDADWITARR